MDRWHDPAVLALPHPVRVDAALGAPIEASLLGADALRERLRPLFLDPSVTSSRLLRNVPELTRLAGVQRNAPASYNPGTFLLLPARARLRVHGDPILAVAPALQKLLGATDLTEGLPVRFFRAPYTMVYIAFPRPCALQVYNRATDLHELEAAYVGSYEVPPHHILHERKTRGAALRLDPARPTRVIELIFTGSPIGKRYALDDASQDVTLFIQDEDECLSAMLARHHAYYAAPRGEDAVVQPPLPVEIACATAAISGLAKVLLYLNLPDAEKLKVLSLALFHRPVPELIRAECSRLSHTDHPGGNNFANTANSSATASCIVCTCLAASCIAFCSVASDSVAASSCFLSDWSLSTSRLTALVASTAVTALRSAFKASMPLLRCCAAIPRPSVSWLVKSAKTSPAMDCDSVSFRSGASGSSNTVPASMRLKST